MDSRPPATTTSTSPVRTWSAAIMIAFIPEPHILLMVVVGTEFGMPAPRAAWRAGAWPRLAGKTQPMITSLTSGAATPESLSAPAIAAVPSSVALTEPKAPRNAPMGVRRAARMTTDEFCTMSPATRSVAHCLRSAPRMIGPAVLYVRQLDATDRLDAAFREEIGGLPARNLFAL